MRPVARPVGSLAVDFFVNGVPQSIEVPVRRLLADVLRDDLGLTGTHVGCEEGSCGACTVIVEGDPVRSCLTLAVQVDGAHVTTVEAFASDAGLDRMQRAFTEQHALQCGFCTPGILTTLAACDPAAYPDEAAVRELLGGNLCRCTGYGNIVSAIRSVWHENAAS